MNGFTTGFLPAAADPRADETEGRGAGRSKVRHPGEGRDPSRRSLRLWTKGVVPEPARIDNAEKTSAWVPAFAGMTIFGACGTQFLLKIAIFGDLVSPAFAGASSGGERFADER